MFYYAKLNQNNICVSIETSVKKLEERNELLRQQDYTPNIINRKWLGDQWSQESYEDVTELERLRDDLSSKQVEIEQLKVGKQELNQQLAQTNADAVAFQDFIFEKFPELA